MEDGFERGVKLQRAERENYGDVAMGYVQLQRNDTKCLVKCRICPEHKVRIKNYTVFAEIDEMEEKILKVKCQDCAASEGGCKHAVAFIMWLHRRSEEPAPTEVECYWKKSTLAGVGTILKFITIKQFGATPLSTHNQSFLTKCVKSGKEVNSPAHLLKYFVDIDKPNLGIYQLICDFGKEKNCAGFLHYASKKMPAGLCNTAFNATKAQSENSLWHDLRYGRITASRIYEAARCKTSSGTLVEAIIGTLKFRESIAMKRGKSLEKEVIST